MGKLATIYDGLVNLVGNLGTSRDKAAHTAYALPILTEQEASNAYRGTWLARKIIDIPALDSVRNWRSWNADQTEISALEAEETRLGLKVKLLEVHTKARLFGGAALYIGTGDQDPSKPLDPARLGKQGIKHLNVLTKRVLTAGERDLDAESPDFGKPAFYTLSSSRAGQVRIHPSRLVILHGAHRPDPDLDGGDGWGDSVLLAISEAVKQADGTSANIASLVFEAKIDIIKIPNLMQLLSDPVTEMQVLDRLRLAMTTKSINGTVVLDAEEDYQQKTASFSGLTDILLAFMQQVSGAADIPITRLLGQAPGGLNATGDNDIRNYYDRIRSGQELTLQPALAVLDECLIYSALGNRPKEAFYNWRSLWQTTDTERATIGKTTADTIKTIADTGLIPDGVMSKVAVNMLTEAGIVPGLESEMDEFEASNPDWQEQQAAEESAAATLATQQQQGQQQVADSLPRPLYVRRDVLNGPDILAWAKSQGFDTTLRADDLHVTVAYSRDPVDWMKAGEDWTGREDGGVTVKPGGARVMEQFGDAVVLLFNSSDLSWRHVRIREAGASWDHPEYQPHVTITYQRGDVDLASIEPYRGAIELGPEIFEPLDDDWQAKLAEA